MLVLPQNLTASITLHLLNDSDSLTVFWLISCCFQRRNLRPLSAEVAEQAANESQLSGVGSPVYPHSVLEPRLAEERLGNLLKQWLKPCLRLQHTDSLSLVLGSPELRAEWSVGRWAGQCPAAPPGSFCFFLPAPPGWLLGFPASQAEFPESSLSPRAA